VGDNYFPDLVHLMETQLLVPVEGSEQHRAHTSGAASFGSISSLKRSPNCGLRHLTMRKGPVFSKACSQQSGTILCNSGQIQHFPKSPELCYPCALNSLMCWLQLTFIKYLFDHCCILLRCFKI